MYYDWSITTDIQVMNNRRDIVVLDKTNNIVFMIDVAFPNNANLLDKHPKKQAINKFYTQLNYKYSTQNIGL